MLSVCNFMGFRNRSQAPPKMNIYAVLGGYSLPSPAGWGWGCLFGCWRTGHGGHRPTFKHICTICSICVRLKYSTIIIRVKYYLFVLQQEVRVFTPLSSGEGLGVGLFSARCGGGASVLYIYAISEAFSKTHQITL